jgi:serine/threonine protein kinase
MEKLGSGLVSVFARNEHEVIKKVKRHRVSAAVVREIAALTALAHPNLLRLISVNLTRGEIILERAQEDCHRWHKRVGKIPSSDLDDMMEQLTAGLTYMHRSGIAHMDMKPQNVLRFSGGVFKIADFGLSCSMLTHDPCGWTLDYRPPEVLRYDIGNYPLPDNLWACESWAFGMMFLNMWFPDPNCMLCCTGSSDDRRQLRKLNRVFGVFLKNGTSRAKMESSASDSDKSCSGCSECDARDAWSSDDEASPASSSSSSDDEEYKPDQEIELESDEEVLLENPPDTKAIIERVGKRVFKPHHWNYIEWYLQVDPSKRKLIVEPGVSTLVEFPNVRVTKRRWAAVCGWMFQCACGSLTTFDPTILLLALQCARYYIGETQVVFTELLGVACYSIASKYLSYDFADWKRWRKMCDDKFTFKRFVHETRNVLNVCAGMLHCDYLPRCIELNLSHYLIQQFLEPKFVEVKELVRRGARDASTIRSVVKLMKHVKIEFAAP